MAVKLPRKLAPSPKPLKKEAKPMWEEFGNCC